MPRPPSPAASKDTRRNSRRESTNLGSRSRKYSIAAEMDVSVAGWIKGPERRRSSIFLLNSADQNLPKVRVSRISADFYEKEKQTDEPAQITEEPQEEDISRPGIQRTTTFLSEGPDSSETPTPGISRTGTAPPQRKKGRFKTLWKSFVKKAVENKDLITDPQPQPVPYNPYLQTPGQASVAPNTAQAPPSPTGSGRSISDASIKEMSGDPALGDFTRTGTFLSDGKEMLEAPPPPVVRAGTAPPETRKNKIKARWSAFAKKAVAAQEGNSEFPPPNPQAVPQPNPASHSLVSTAPVKPVLQSSSEVSPVEVGPLEAGPLEGGPLAGTPVQYTQVGGQLVAQQFPQQYSPQISPLGALVVRGAPQFAPGSPFAPAPPANPQMGGLTPQYAQQLSGQHFVPPHMAGYISPTGTATPPPPTSALQPGMAVPNAAFLGVAPVPPAHRPSVTSSVSSSRKNGGWLSLVSKAAQKASAALDDPTAAPKKRKESVALDLPPELLDGRKPSIVNSFIDPNASHGSVSSHQGSVGGLGAGLAGWGVGGGTGRRGSVMPGGRRGSIMPGGDRRGSIMPTGFMGLPADPGGGV